MKNDAVEVTTQAPRADKRVRAAIERLRKVASDRQARGVGVEPSIVLECCDQAEGKPC